MNLEIQKLRKLHGSQKLFDEVSLSISSSVVAFIGPSGSGKSTLLRLIAGLDFPDKGEIFLEGKKVPVKEGKELLDYRKSLGVVFQSWNLFPHLNAIENIMLPLRVAHGLSEDEAYARSSELLSRFALLPHAIKKPSQLSGGQNQRVAILRALAHRPSVLLLDEPTSALDPIMTSEVLDLVFELKAEGTSFLIVSHHLPFLRRIADEVVFMAEGKIIEQSPSNQFFTNPVHDQVRNYLDTILKYD